MYRTSYYSGKQTNNSFFSQQIDVATSLAKARKYADNGDPAEGMVMLMLEFHKIRNSFDKEKFVQIVIEIIGYMGLDFPEIHNDTIDDFNAKADEFLGKEIGEKLRKVAVAGLQGVGQIASDQSLSVKRTTYDNLTGKITYKDLKH